MANQVKTTRFSTDRAMKILYGRMVRDFRSVMGPGYKESQLRCLEQNDIAAFRNIPTPDCFQAPPYIFKMEAQLANLFKRYRFSEDLYTNKELTDRTMQKFMATQTRVCEAIQRSPKSSTFAVLQRARTIIREILADFDPSQCETSFRFSTRATVGNPASDAYIDHKLSDPISGSSEHVKWFRNHLGGNEYLASVIRACQPVKGEPVLTTCESLPLVLVPKSYKALRPISPNTLIGSYYTYGLGKVIVGALKAIGLDIRKLQIQHKYWAKRASVDRRMVTADLSAASESYYWSLIARLMPRKWLKWLDRGRLRNFTFGGSQYHYASFMAMGIGFTFPLQTLLFYSLVKATCDLLGVKGMVSVYGDDLIYPRPAHAYVESVLTDLGMVLNKDKTFVNTHFRESCGGDYYHGVDVRPFNPEGEYRELTSKKYEAWLYQMANGLLERWSPEEIPETLLFLRSELLSVTCLIKQVPPSYPDYSGWRVEQPIYDPKYGMVPVLCRFQNGTREFKVPHLVQAPRHRYVSFQEAYLYDALRSMENPDELKRYPTDQGPAFYQHRSFSFWLKKAWKATPWTHKTFFETSEPGITWLRHPSQPKRYRAASGRRLIRTIAATPCAVEDVRYKTAKPDSISDWT